MQALEFWQSQRRSRFASGALGLLLLAMPVGWLLEQAIAPTIVHADTSKVDLRLDVLPGESFETLVRRAEVIARVATQRTFDRDILTSAVSVVITAQTQTTAVPILTLAATRSQWKSRPDVRNWTTYFRSSRSLLGLSDSPAIVPASTVPASTVPASTPTPTGQGGAAPTQPTLSQPVPTQPTAVPTSAPLPSQPATPQPASTGSPNDGTVSQPTSRPQIIPDRIPTPGRIGK